MEPDELRYKEFKRSVRGYNPDEVDDLLDSVANELEELRTERTRLTAELDEARARIEQYESLEGSIRATLAQAEKAASDYQEAARKDAESTREAARREAGIVIHDAETRSRRMLAETSSKVRRIQESYEALRQTRNSFDSEFRGLLEGYLRHLDEANSATAREIEAPLRERLDTGAISDAHAAAEEERREQFEKEGGRVDSHEDVGEEPGPDPTSAEAGEGEPGEAGDASSEEEPATDDAEETGSESPGRGRFLRWRG